MKFNFDEYIKTGGREYLPNIPELQKKAKQYLINGDTKNALLKIIQCLLMGPKKFRSLMLLTEFFDRIKIPRFALVTAEYNYEVNPNIFEVHVDYIKYLVSNHRRDKAEEILMKSALQFRKNKQNLIFLANTAWQLESTTIAAGLEYCLLQGHTLKENEIIRIVDKLLAKKALTPTWRTLVSLSQGTYTALPANIALAEALLAIGKVSDAQKALDRISNRMNDDKSVNTKFLLLEASISNANLLPKKTISCLDKIDPKLLNNKQISAEYFRLYAHAFRLTGRLDDSRTMFDKAIQSGDILKSTEKAISTVLDEINHNQRIISNFSENSMNDKQRSSTKAHGSKVRFDYSEKRNNEAQGNKLEKLTPNIFNMDTSDYANPEIEITKLKDLIKTAALSKSEKISSIFKLGHLFGCCERWTEAFECWQTGGFLFTNHQNFNVDLFVTRFLEVKKLNLENKNDLLNQYKFKGEQFIFLFGLPETGLEEIRGVLKAANASVLSQTQSLSQRLRRIYNRYKVLELQEKYFRSKINDAILEEITKFENFIEVGQRRHTITMDFVGLDLTLIARLANYFPKATFLTTNRGRLETKIAMFSELYEEGNNFTYDLDNLEIIYSKYRNNFNIVKKIIEERLIEIDYSWLLDGQEVLIRKLSKKLSQPHLIAEAQSHLSKFVTALDTPFEYQFNLSRNYNYKSMQRYFNQNKFEMTQQNRLDVSAFRH